MPQAPVPQSTISGLAKWDVVRQLSYRNGDFAVPLRRFSRGAPLALGEPLFFQSKMSCDVDGAPNAYHPVDDTLALDTISSAEGVRENGLAAGPLAVLPSPEIVAYDQGKPYIQVDGDYRGFFVSRTSLENEALPKIDPNRYLDARKIQYIVLPSGMVPEAQVGDLAAAYDPVSHSVAYAVFGDIGPVTESGEASIATLHRLGVTCMDGKSCPCEDRHDLLFIVFPGTAGKLQKADKWPYLQRTIDRLAEVEFRNWGGLAAAQIACSAG